MISNGFLRAAPKALGRRTLQTASASWSNSMGFASPESDFCSGAKPLPEPMRVPQSLAEAMHSKHACVVTTAQAPFHIVHVNRAWENLCGYTQSEVLHASMSVIQGTKTNTELVENTVQEIAQHVESKKDVYLVNYKKDGSPFKNHLTMSTMKLSEHKPEVEFLVGVLEEVDTVPLRMI